MRLLYSAGGFCALAIVLCGCGQGPSAPTEPMLTMPPSPTIAAQTHAAPSATGVPKNRSGQTAAEPSEHCVIVAGGVTTAMLAPLSLRSTSDPEELTALKQQILDLRSKVPADLHDDFTTLAHSVEAPPGGLGTFDDEAFRRAMVPLQDWLGEHCTHS